jgi:hypothetical protein
MVTNSKSYMRKYAHDNYAEYRWQPIQKKKRAARNKAHKLMNPPKGKEVHHKDGNPLNNSPKNRSVVSKLFNERH